ncbi:MAG: hypothetical protein PVI23_07540 [Maricaulaceae bacterium]|jgi:hypothetical protein
MLAENVWTAHGAEWRLTGVVTREEIDELNRAFTNDPRSDHARYQLLDLRDVPRIDMTMGDAQMVGAYDAAQSLSTPAIRVAILTPDDRFDDLIAGYAEMLEGGSWTVRAFTDEAEARAWISQAAAREPRKART